MAELAIGKRDIIGIRAPNVGRFNVSGPNSWIVARNPAWLIDPGPDFNEHVAALLLELERRGGLGGIALTHDHWDHGAAVPSVRAAYPHAPVAAARGEVDVQLRDGGRVGPLEAVATPGHAPDHLTFLTSDVAFTGDAVMGEGSVFVAPYPGSMSSYIAGLRRLQARAPASICPGHGPIVTNAAARLDEVIAHRLERERRLLAALGAGLRTVDELLDDVWSGVPEPLRPAAAATLAAHLDKLADEGRLPPGCSAPTSKAGRTRPRSSATGALRAPASARRLRASASAQLSGVAPIASAWSKIWRSVSAIRSTRWRALAGHSPRARRRC